MEPPREFDVEGPWDNIEDDWDLIHLRALLGSVQCWNDLYRMIYRLEPLFLS